MAEVTGNRGETAPRRERLSEVRTPSPRQRPRPAKRKLAPGSAQRATGGVQFGHCLSPFSISSRNKTLFDASQCLQKTPGIGAEPQVLLLAHCGDRLIPQEQEKACWWTLCPAGLGGTSYLAAGHRGPKSFRHRRQVSCSLRLLAASGFVIAENGAMQ